MSWAPADMADETLFVSQRGPPVDMNVLFWYHVLIQCAHTWAIGHNRLRHIGFWVLHLFCHRNPRLVVDGVLGHETR